MVVNLINLSKYYREWGEGRKLWKFTVLSDIYISPIDRIHTYNRSHSQKGRPHHLLPSHSPNNGHVGLASSSLKPTGHTVTGLPNKIIPT